MSNTYALKKFQTRAIEELVDNLGALRGRPNDKPRRMLLTAPCGAGKTVIAGSVLDAATADALTLVITPGAGALAEQTHASLRRTISDDRDVILVSEPDDLKAAAPGTVYVTNYEKLVVKHRAGNKYGRDGQYKSRVTADREGFNWWNMLTAAKDAGTDVIVMVDEAHYGSSKSAGAIRTFFDEVSSHLGYIPVRFEATATPPSGWTKYEDDDDRYTYTVRRGSVVREGLIRKDAILNPGYKEWSADRDLASIDEENALMELMFQQWSRARLLAHSLGRATPLMMFCIDNANKTHDDREKVELFLATKTDPVTGKALTASAGTVGVHLADSKVNLGEMGSIANPDSPVLALVFKQAIATGWDCPRAQFMMIMRSIASSSFKEQLIGRILRQPTGSATGEELLDHGYVFAAVNREFQIPKALSGVLEEPTKVSPAPADPEKLALWHAAAVQQRHATRERAHGDVSAAGLAQALAAVDVKFDKVASDFSSMHASDASLSDNAVSANEMFSGAGSEVDAAARIREALMERMSAHQVGPKVRCVMAAVPALRALGASHDSARPWSFLAANRDALDPALTVLAEHAKRGSENRNTFVQGSWEAFAPSTSRVVDADGARELDDDLASTHLYGKRTDHAVSAAERGFEDAVLGSLLDTVSWFKNEPHLVEDGSKSTSFSLTYSTDSAITNFYPDYLALVKDSTGKIVPMIFEVKGAGFEDGSADSSRFHKARALRDYRQGSARAAAVYNKSGTWMVVKGGVLQDGSMDEEPLATWLDEVL